jgi:hypothetical protein
MNRNSTIEHPAAQCQEMTPPTGDPVATRFPLGQLLITPNAQSRLHPTDVFSALSRHAAGNWGQLGKQDRQENDLSLEQGFRLLSAYRDRFGIRFWIITDAERCATTILLPEDY